jgi:hypothetical protein
MKAPVLTAGLALLLGQVHATPALYAYAHIFSSETTPQYLGWAVPDRSDPYSIINPYGSYGSPFSATSIRNEYGAYGSPYRTYSAYNLYAASPPKLYFWNASTERYDFAAWLTKSTIKFPRCDPDELIAYLDRGAGAPSANDYPTLTRFDFAPQPVRPQTAVTFHLEATDPDGDLITYSIDYGDGSPYAYASGTSTTLIHAYALPGAYTGRLMILDSHAIGFYYEGTLLGSGTFSIQVNDYPRITMLSLNTLTTRVGLAISAVADGTDPENDPLSFAWNFHDGSPIAYGKSITHAYATEGAHRMSLSLQDGHGVGCYYLHILTGSLYNDITVLSANPSPVQLAVTSEPGSLAISWEQAAAAAYKLYSRTPDMPWHAMQSPNVIRPLNQAGPQEVRIPTTYPAAFYCVKATPEITP